MTVFHSDTMKQWVANLRDEMACLLTGCTEAQQDLFRRMYDHAGKHERPVDAVPFDRLDGAFRQIERTLEKNASTADGATP